MTKEATRPITYGELGFHVIGDSEVLTHDYMAIPVTDSDPSELVKGQIWYNTTDSQLKVCIDDSGTVVVFDHD